MTILRVLTEIEPAAETAWLLRALVQQIDLKIQLNKDPKAAQAHQALLVGEASLLCLENAAFSQLTCIYNSDTKCTATA